MTWQFIEKAVYIPSQPQADRPRNRSLPIRQTITICEGYTDTQIRTDGQYIRNVARGSAHCIYIVWLYEPRTQETIQLIPHNMLMNPSIV